MLRQRRCISAVSKILILGKRLWLGGWTTHLKHMRRSQVLDELKSLWCDHLLNTSPMPDKFHGILHFYASLFIGLTLSVLSTTAGIFSHISVRRNALDGSISDSSWHACFITILDMYMRCLCLCIYLYRLVCPSFITSCCNKLCTLWLAYPFPIELEDRTSSLSGSKKSLGNPSKTSKTLCPGKKFAHQPG